MYTESRLTLTYLETCGALCRGENTAAESESSPHAIAHTRQQRRILRSAQAHLSGKQMLLLILLYEEGLSQMEAAAELGMSQQGLSKMHHRLLRVLRVELAGSGIVSLRQIL